MQPTHEQMQIVFFLWQYFHNELILIVECKQGIFHSFDICIPETHDAQKAYSYSDYYSIVQRRYIMKGESFCVKAYQCFEASTFSRRFGSKLNAVKLQVCISCTQVQI